MIITNKYINLSHLHTARNNALKLFSDKMVITRIKCAFKGS